MPAALARDTIRQDQGRREIVGEGRKKDLFICRDTALTDELAANLALQCRLKTL